MNVPANFASTGFAFRVYPEVEAWIAALPVGTEAYAVCMIEIEGSLRAGVQRLNGVLEGPQDCEVLRAIGNWQVSEMANIAECGHIVIVAYTDEAGIEVSHEVSVGHWGWGTRAVPFWAPRTKRDLLRQVQG